MDGRTGQKRRQRLAKRRLIVSKIVISLVFLGGTTLAILIFTGAVGPGASSGSDEYFKPPPGSFPVTVSGGQIKRSTVGQNTASVLAATRKIKTSLPASSSSRGSAVRQTSFSTDILAMSTSTEASSSTGATSLAPSSFSVPTWGSHALSPSTTTAPPTSTSTEVPASTSTPIPTRSSTATPMTSSTAILSLTSTAERTSTSTAMPSLTSTVTPASTSTPNPTRSTAGTSSTSSTAIATSTSAATLASTSAAGTTSTGAGGTTLTSTAATTYMRVETTTSLPETTTSTAAATTTTTRATTPAATSPRAPSSTTEPLRTTIGLYTQSNRLYAPIRDGLRPGKNIRVRGTPKTDARTFTVDIQTGEQGLEFRSFHFNPRFWVPDDGVVVRNSIVNGRWGVEERHGPRSIFRRGQPFDLRFQIETERFRVYVDEQHFIDYTFRVSPSITDMVSVHGDVVVDTIEYY